MNDFQSVLCVALSPDGRLLASGDEGDRAVHIWDEPTGKKLAQFEGHRGNIYCVAFFPDGKTAASGSAETTIRPSGLVARKWIEDKFSLDVAIPELKAYLEWVAQSFPFRISALRGSRTHGSSVGVMG